MSEIKKVLFICTGNSARSQMAEGLLNTLGSGRWRAQSGGLFPSYVHPLAIRAMAEIGIDISQQTSKSMDSFLEDDFDYIVTLCDHAAKACPVFPGQAKRLHWSLEDPAIAVGTIDERLMVFRKVRDEIKKRIEGLIESESPLTSTIKNP